MMYASVEEFILRVGEIDALALTDRERLGEVNAEVLTLALEDSSSQIDGYLAGRYRLPLNEKPRNLARLCCDLTRYRLASLSDVTIHEEIIARYKLSIRELEQIAEGKISLGLSENQPNNPEDKVSGVQFFNGNNRIFSRDNP
ncbi:hypothetical protein A4G19_03740 [Pasteurellaceae bacterium Macca]|nr:hypothetical protein [Pasteurellaceae bacterium Macca]